MRTFFTLVTGSPKGPLVSASWRATVMAYLMRAMLGAKSSSKVLPLPELDWSPNDGGKVKCSCCTVELDTL